MVVKSLSISLLLISGWIGAYFLPSRPPSPIARRALLVGCTDYQYTNLPDLWGPSNDVPIWSRTLINLFGFAEKDVRSLVGWPENPANRPTRKNIVDSIQEMLNQSVIGDQVVILLAGHGAQVPSHRPSNDSGHIEKDGLNEVFLPADVKGWSDGAIENAIVDDEIGRWLDQFRKKGVHVWIIFDCCHASGLAKPPSTQNQDTLSDHRAVHFEHLGVPSRPIDPSKSADPSRVESGPGWLDEGWNRGDAPGSVVAFYACQGTELAPESPHPKDAPRIRENYYGLFSYSIVAILSQSKKPLSYHELYQQIESRYALNRPGLPPKIAVEGAMDRPLLGLDSAPRPMIFAFSNHPTLGGIINGGELMGLMTTSILAIHPGSGDSRSPREVLGYLRVKSLGPTTALVEPVNFGRCVAVGPEVLKAGMICEVVVD